MQIDEVKWELDPAELASGLSVDKYLLEPRSPGTHQSDIVRDLEHTVLKPGQRKPDAELDQDEMDTLNRYRELGMTWEVVLDAAFKARRIDKLDPSKFLRQVEVEKDEVFVTTDAVYIPQWRVLEFKLTYRSSNRASIDRIEVEFWAWFSQLKSNCLVHETRLASLFVFFVNGNYHPPVPTTKRFDIIFEDQELLDNWNMLLRHREVMRKEGRLPAND